MFDLNFLAQKGADCPISPEKSGELEKYLIDQGFHKRKDDDGELLFEKNRPGNSLWYIRFSKYYTAVRLDKKKGLLFISTERTPFTVFALSELKKMKAFRAGIYGIMGVTPPSSDGFRKLNSLFFKLHPLIPLYLVITAAFLYFTATGGYFFLKNRAYVLSERFRWEDAESAIKKARELNGQVLFIYFNKKDEWYRYDFRNIFSGRRLNKYLEEKRIYPVKVEIERYEELAEHMICRTPFMRLADPDGTVKVESDFIIDKKDLIETIELKRFKLIEKTF